MRDQVVLFHGSYLPIEHPKVIKGEYRKDFGDGFYLTTIQNQAERWANRKARNMAVTEPGCKPTVSVYILDKTAVIERFPSQLFPRMSDDWLDFIALNRSGGEHPYQYVEGPMADDKVYNFVEAFISGRIPRETFWELCRFDYPTHQTMLRGDALKELSFVESYTLEERR